MGVADSLMHEEEEEGEKKGEKALTAKPKQRLKAWERCSET